MAIDYKPGEKVPESGIYRVTHDAYHTAPHEVTCVRSEPFPPCRHCGPNVRFALVRAAKHLSEDEHLGSKQ